MDVLIDVCSPSRPRGRSQQVLPHFLLACVLFLSGCQIPYLMKSAYSQAELLRHRVPLDEALSDPSLTEDQKRKLLLAREAREFAEKNLSLAHTENYTSFVQLDRPYVTYVVSAAPKDKLEHYLWRYPIVGELPYMGFFNPHDADEEQRKLEEKNLDTYVRGVSAYSTLGWFRDPILSSMLTYKDHDLVNTIIHETVHATVYIKSEADFNERLAMFIGNAGTEAFYLNKEGPDGPSLKLIASDAADDRVFGLFISRELKDLEQWYKDRTGQNIAEETRKARFLQIKERFKAEVRPRLASKDSYRGFENAELNNARLLTYRLYFEDLSEFQLVFDQFGHDFKRMLSFAKQLEKSKDPVSELHRKAHNAGEGAGVTVGVDVGVAVAKPGTESKAFRRSVSSLFITM